MRLFRGVTWLAVAAPLFSGCGLGTAGIAAGASSGGGSGSTPAMELFAVENPKESPCVLRLDASKAVRVGLFYDMGGGEQPMMHLMGVSGNEVDLPVGEISIPWDFEAELGTTDFIENVRLMAKSGGVLLGGGALTVGMGNDPPAVTVEPVAAEVDGVVPVRFRLSDSSADLVDVRVEFHLEQDPPDTWTPARPGGIPPGPTPDPALEGIEAPKVPVERVFFWDTDHDLAQLERDVRLRFTAIDPVVPGRSALSNAFRVDNNEEPIVQLDSGPLILNPDERRGIPVPFRVIDEEEDLVEMIFQWRREGEQFPNLDRDGDGTIENDEVDEILADPLLRVEHHVCTEYPHPAQGLVVPIDADTVRLPELARGESWILASGIVGKTLELLRPSSIPTPITPTWRSNPLVSPIAALPLGDGLSALVLDVPGNGRLREIELATGAVVREIAMLGPGIPRTMTFEKREQAVLVALDYAGSWRIERVELASGAITELVVSDGTEPAPVRGIASLGTQAAVFTAGTSLFHLDYRDLLAPKLGKLLTSLVSPWGVVADPLPPDQLYVSERDANRVLAVELDSHGTMPVVVKTEDMQLDMLEAPEALALERSGSRMLIVTSAPGGGQELVGLDLGAQGGNVSFLIGTPLGSDVAGLSVGPEGLRLVCLAGAGELLVAGGIEQRRVISAHSAMSQDATVASPLAPVPAPGQPWRISDEGKSLSSSALGVASRFVWDSTDAGAGRIFLRAVARDDELGAAVEGAATKNVRSPLDVEALLLGGFGVTDSPSSIAAADLDGDGDQDIVSANYNGNNLTVFRQESPGSFASAPLVLGGFGVTTRPFSVAAADLDGDGDLDLVSANQLGNNLTVFWQESPGSFASAPLVLGDPWVTNFPSSVAAADLDGDGDLDLVSANGNNLTVFWQESPGSFASAPLVLGGPGVTNFPSSVSAADLDGDGDQDLVSANRDGNNLTVFRQESPGSFASAPLALGGLGVTLVPVSVAAADLDGDGDQDLVSANYSGHNLTVFWQESPGSFASAPLVLGDPGVTNIPSSVAAADLDGDGDQDLVSTNYDGHNLTVFRQESPGSFASTPLVLGGLAVTNAPYSVAAADLDGDGDQDLVSANLGGYNLTAFGQESPGSFTSAPIVLGGLGVTSDPWSVAVADLDGDGDQDVVSANAGGDNLTVFRQESPGSFASAPLVLGDPGVTNFPISVAAADLDSDGDLDLVSANSFSNNLTVFRQELPGSFGSVPLVLGGPGVTINPSSVAAADLDGDGDQDLVSANANGLTVFWQESPGSFASAPPVLGGPGVTSVATADLDGDGDQDLVSANQADNNLTVFRQESPGSFASAPLVLGGIGVTDAPWSVAAADLDDDGDLDLVSTNFKGDSLTVFRQESPGSFASAPLVLGGLDVTYDPISVATADLDGDGDQDLVSANWGNSTLTVFRQESLGSFASAPLVLGGVFVTDSPFSVAAADLDGDGDQDLVSANANGHNLTVFWGGR